MNLNSKIIKNIVIITQDFSINGGLNILTRQIFSHLKNGFEVTPKLISLATSKSDTSSIRILSPITWIKKLNIVKRKSESIDYIHIGSYFVEIEFFRYLCRDLLNKELEDSDLIIFVAVIRFH